MATEQTTITKEQAILAQTPCPAWTVDEQERSVCRDLMEGITALRAARTTYLPQKELENDTAYQKRLDTATFFNQFSRTVDSLSGRVFSKEVKFEDASDDWAAFEDDVDMEGNNLHVFAQEVFSAAIAEGISYIMVDFPSLPTAPNQEVELKEKRTRRPYWIFLKAAEVIGWKFERVNGTNVLVELRTLQYRDVETSMFVFEKKKILRVYRLGSCHEFQCSEAGAVESEQIFKMSIPIIPLIPVYTKRKGQLRAAPPLHDMARLCVRHYQSTSSQDHILDYSRFPLLFGKRLFLEGTSKIEQGASAMIHSQDEHGDLRFVEHTGAAIASGADSLKALEGQIALLSYEPLLKQSTGDESATRAALDTATASSALQSWAMGLKDALELAAVYTTLWKSPGLTDAPNVSVNTSHGLSASAAEYQAILELRKGKDISRSTMWKEMYRRGILGPSFNEKDEEELLKLEAAMDERGEGFIATQVQAGNLPKELLFREAQKKGLIPADVKWEDVLAMMSKENVSSQASPLPGFDNLFGAGTGTEQ